MAHMKIFNLIFLVFFFLLTGCSSLRLQYSSKYKTQSGQEGNFLFEKSIDISPQNTFCAVSGIFYGGACWFYLLYPNEQHVAQLTEDAKEAFKQYNKGDPFDLIEPFVIKKVNWKNNPPKIVVDGKEQLLLENATSITPVALVTDGVISSTRFEKNYQLYGRDNTNGYFDFSKKTKFSDGRMAFIISQPTPSGTTQVQVLVKEFPEIKLIPIAFWNREVSEEENFEKAITALRFAIESGARVIYYNSSGLKVTKQEVELLKQAESKDIMVIVSVAHSCKWSCNQQSLENITIFKNILVIGAYDEKIFPMRSLYRDPKHIQLMFPGFLPKGFLESYKDNVTFSPSSDAVSSAYACGTVARLRDIFPNKKTSEIIHALMKTVKHAKGLEKAAQAEGVVQLDKAIQLLQE